MGVVSSEKAISVLEKKLRSHTPGGTGALMEVFRRASSLKNLGDETREYHYSNTAPRKILVGKRYSKMGPTRLPGPPDLSKCTTEVRESGLLVNPPRQETSALSSPKKISDGGRLLLGNVYTYESGSNTYSSGDNSHRESN